MGVPMAIIGVEINALRQVLGGSCGITKIPTVPTRVHTLDLMIGGGIPVGRTTSIVGKGGTGKSTLMYSLLDSTIELGGVGILIDNEHNYTQERVVELGFLHLAENIIILPDVTLEGLFHHFNHIVDILSKIPNFRFGFIVIDSWSTMLSEGEMSSGNPGVGVHARFASTFFRNAVDLMSRYNIGIIFVLQEKQKIMMMPGMGGKGPQAGYGYLAQNAIYANSFLEIRMIRTKGIKSGSSTVGMNVKAISRKNKLAPPFRELTLDYYFSAGYDRARTILEALVAIRIAKKSGGWYDVNGTKLQAGVLRQQPELMSQLEELVYKADKSEIDVGAISSEVDQSVINAMDDPNFKYPGEEESDDTETSDEEGIIVDGDA